MSRHPNDRALLPLVVPRVPSKDYDAVPGRVFMPALPADVSGGVLMTQPTVACIMLANGRPEMVARAVKSFHAQTYPRCELLIYDTGDPLIDKGEWRPEIYTATDRGSKKSIGALRNDANTCMGADILLHFDSDDWSHLNRIAEQVALLQSSGAECVGYNEMLFLDSTPGQFCGAWLYRASIPKYVIGTSMCYWRETWERHPFPDRSEGCDDLYWFNAGVKIASVSAFQDESGIFKDQRMIASIHGGNTCSRIDAKAREWTRLPACDNYAREAMRL